MPFSINGIGTEVCRGRGLVRWGGEPDSDSMECLTVLGMPIIPYATVHTYNWNGTRYLRIPIRPSFGLFARVYVRRWIVWPVLIAGICCLFSGAMMFVVGATGKEKVDPRGPPIMAAGGAGVSLVGWALFGLYRRTDRRDCSIRRVLGRHRYGSSDPAHWTDPLLEAVTAPKEQFGTIDFAAAVPHLLRTGDFSNAMWAARFCVAKENLQHGEELTDQILADPRVQEAIKRVEKDWTCWAQEMRPASAASPASGAA